MSEQLTQTALPAPKHGVASLYFAYRWCLYSWVCLAIGIGVMHAADIMVRAFGAALVVGSCLFAFVAIGLSALGFVVPTRCNRRLFWGPLALALPPLIYLFWQLTGT